MLYPVKAIIFDLDGVIINSNPAIEAFWKSWTDKAGINLTAPLVRQWIHGRKVQDTIEGLFGHLPESTKEQIEKEGYDFDSQMQPGPVTGVIKFIEVLRTLGIPTGIVTSSHYSRMFKMISDIGIEEKIRHFITANDSIRGKPFPDPYLKMGEKLHIPEKNCLVFEDAISGITSAVAAGMQSIGIADASAASDLLQQGAQHIIPDFSGISIQENRLVFPNGFQCALES